MSHSSRVVVIIPAYNGGDFLKQSVASLLNQKLASFRIVVIDDASNDGSIQSLNDWEEAGLIEIRRNECNLGKAKSLNLAFEEIDAEYFILQDADDIATPDRVARQLAFMTENPEIGCSSSFINYINSSGAYLAAGKLDLLDDEKLYEYLNSDNPFGLYCPSVILKAQIVKNPKLRFRGEFWPADDIDLWNRIAEAGYIVRAQPEFLVSYRIHGKSVVTSGFSKSRMQYEWLRACLRARRSGDSEPSREDFLNIWNSVPWVKRINRARKFYAKGYYREAGFFIAENSYINGIIKGFMSILLQPSYALQRVFTQLQNRF